VVRVLLDIIVPLARVLREALRVHPARIVLRVPPFSRRVRLERIVHLELQLFHRAALLLKHARITLHPHLSSVLGARTALLLA
jgi:hypothetical protein